MIAEGMEIIEMPGSTHSRTWEVTSVEADEVTMEVVDKAVGYDYGNTITVDRGKLADCVDDGVLTGGIVKVAPDFEEVLVR